MRDYISSIRINGLGVNRIVNSRSAMLGAKIKVNGKSHYEGNLEDCLGYVKGDNSFYSLTEQEVFILENIKCMGKWSDYVSDIRDDWIYIFKSDLRFFTSKYQSDKRPMQTGNNIARLIINEETNHVMDNTHLIPCSRGHFSKPVIVAWHLDDSILARVRLLYG